MQGVSEEDLEAFLAAEALPEALDPGVHPDLDHVPDHHLGEFNVLNSELYKYVTCIICRTNYVEYKRKYQI